MVRKAALIAMMFASPALADVDRSIWRDFWRGNDGTIFYLEASKLGNTDNPNPIIWLHGDHSKDKTTKARTSYYRLELSCNGQSVRVIQSSVTYADGRTETFNAQGQWESPIPGSLYENILDAACPSKEPPEWLQSPVVG